MKKDAVLAKLKQQKVIAIIRAESSDGLLDCAKALAEGGLTAIELTMTTPGAIRMIEQVSAQLPDFVFGLGTVLDTETARAGILAGAQFIVTPGFMPRVTAVCLERKVPIFPGVMTPTEIGMALDAGLSDLKFFPSEAAGGLATLRALAGPFPTVRFIPTGGIGPGNVASYLREPTVLAVGGSWMIRTDLLESGDWATVRDMAERAVAIVRDVRGDPAGSAPAASPPIGVRP